MPEPLFSATLERLYARLPEFVRIADVDQHWAAKRYVSLIGDQVGDLEVLLDRIDYVTVADGGVAGDTSELVDPAKADASWLRWLAQAVSVVPTGLTTPALRDSIANARTGWQVGSQDAVIAAVQAHLIDTRRVSIARVVGGDPFHATVRTYALQTPTATYADLAADFGSYADLAATYPTYADIPNAATAIERALALQAPAHVQLDLEVLDGPLYSDIADGFATYADLAAAFPTYADMASYVP